MVGPMTKECVENFHLEGAFSMPSIQKAVDDFTSDWKMIYGDKTIADLD